MEIALLLMLVVLVTRNGEMDLPLNGKRFAMAILGTIKPMVESRGFHANAARLLTAQAMLETGDGFQIKDSNAWNITAGANWRGSTIEGGDRDASGGSIRQKFRAYASFTAAAQDLFSVLGLKRYERAVALLKLGDESYIEELGKAGWYSLAPEEYRKRMRLVLARLDRYLQDGTTGMAWGG